MERREAKMMRSVRDGEEEDGDADDDEKQERLKKNGKYKK